MNIEMPAIDSYMIKAGAGVGKIILIILATWLADILIKMAVHHLRRPKALIALAPKRRQRRWKTVTSLLATTSQIVVNFIGFLLILDVLGVNLAPFLAGASIIGLAVGFGAKTLVSDLIAGFFILLEDQFNVGDWVQIGSYRGRVTKLSLRTLHLRDKAGNAYIIPNSTIKTVMRFRRPPKD